MGFLCSDCKLIYLKLNSILPGFFTKAFGFLTESAGSRLESEGINLSAEISSSQSWICSQCGSLNSQAIPICSSCNMQNGIESASLPVTLQLIENILHDPKTSALDKEKLILEHQKMALEYEKLRLENRKLAVGLYVEDFKARWQELLNFENENNRWITLYVTALLLVISWILNNSDKYHSLYALYNNGDNAYFILAISVVNAIYTFAMAFKGYQIQQIALYQYELLAGGIWENAGIAFNEWERYRREMRAGKKGPEPIRRIYYTLIGSLPTLVSYTIIVLYLRFGWMTQHRIHGFWSFRNWFCYGAIALVTLSLIFAFKTSGLNKKWDKALSENEKRAKRS